MCSQFELCVCVCVCVCLSVCLSVRLSVCVCVSVSRAVLQMYSNGTVTVETMLLS